MSVPPKAELPPVVETLLAALEQGNGGKHVLKPGGADRVAEALREHFDTPALKLHVLELFRSAVFFAECHGDEDLAAQIVTIMAPALANLRGQGVVFDATDDAQAAEVSGKRFEQFTGAAAASAPPSVGQEKKRPSLSPGDLAKGPRKA